MFRSSRRARVICLLGLLLAGCSSGGGASSSGASSGAPSSAVSLPVASTAAEGPDAPGAIARADVQKLVDGWLAAQNTGDLTAYLALYAERFEGVRRSGSRAARMDRKGWAADRTKMFTKKMVVTAEEVVISTTPATAQITLTQTWASGSYKDVGPKLLVVVKEKGALRIAREEMLASSLQGVKRLPPHPTDELAFVIQDGGTRVVLDASPQVAWGEGAPELLADAVPFPTKVAVAPGKLPPALAAWAGKKMRLYGPAGPVCEATLGGPALVGRVIPHFGEVATWHGTADGANEKPLSKARIAREAWALAAAARPHGVVLAADLASSQGDCKGALWAQPASAPERKVAKAEDAGPELSKKVLAELRKLPEYKEIQSTSETTAPWDERGKTQVVVMRHPSGKQLAFISANAVEGCGGFQGNLAAVFELNGDRLVLAGKPMGVPPEMPAGAVDPGGGRLEILFTERLWRGEAGYDQVDELSIPFLDCGC
jgi:ketosteroid isomerase-like protein